MRFDQRHDVKMDRAFEAVVGYKYLKDASFLSRNARYKRSIVHVRFFLRVFL